MNHARSVLLAALAFGVGQTASAAPPTKENSAAVEQLLLATDRAWDAKDGKGMAALFTPDGNVQAMPEMPTVVGSAELQKFFGENFADRPNGLRHVTHVDRLEALGPAGTLADATVAIEQRQSDGSWKQVMLFHSVYVAERRGQSWQLHIMRSFPAG